MGVVTDGRRARASVTAMMSDHRTSARRPRWFNFRRLPLGEERLWWLRDQPIPPSGRIGCKRTHRMIDTMRGSVRMAGGKNRRRAVIVAQSE
jgi:hypothetical protein